MKPSEDIAKRAWAHGHEVAPSTRNIDAGCWAKAICEYLDEQQNLPRLAAAYCAHLLAACGYPGYDTTDEQCRAELEATLRVGARLGVPEDVIAKLYDSPNEALARFAAWLEKGAE